MIVPKFIESERAYFNIDTNTIYADKKGSREYWHEYSHYKDYSNLKYREWALYFDRWLQFMMTYGLLILIIFGFYIYVLFLLPYSFWRIQSEIRAEYFSYRKRKKPSR